ncbi:MAG TPA: hypothetical protein VHT97_12665 [Acidimicrobiales bacterium]|nr:hypothetical protein [Acidimicrobiales bacterium]
MAIVVLGTALSLAPGLAGAQAVGGIGTAITPAFTSPVVVGAQNQPALVQFVNASFGTAAGDTVTLSNIRLNPSCATSTVDTNPADPSPCPTPEPRPIPGSPIITLSPSSTVANTTCPGGPFAITGPDAEGDYTITPTTGPITLGPVGSPTATCSIGFTFNVVQRPTDGSTFQVASLVATSPTFPGGLPQSGASAVVVNQATPALTTVSSNNTAGMASVPVGSTVTDQATVTGVANVPAPTGTVTYSLVGPGPNGTCTSATVPPNGPATVPIGSPSPSFTLPSAGTYNFVASYSGDTNYAPIANTGCGVANELVTATLRTLALTTSASTNLANVPSGTVVSDTATLTPTIPGPVPTGTVTYTLVGPNPNGACTAPIVGSSTVAAGAASGPFTVTLPGTYNFTATYSGDGNYAAITTPVGCGAPTEQFGVAPVPVPLRTQASTNSATVAPGTMVTDTGIFTTPAGFPAPTGTVTYTLVGPGPNASCTAPVVGAPSTVAAGSPSGSFTVNTPGTYNFVATYSGDANFQPTTTPVGCGDPNEIFTVATLPIGLSTHASTNAPNLAPGTAVTDTATFTPPPGGPAPTGTVTYRLIGPNPNGTCTAPVVGAPSTTAVGSPSASFVVTAPGTYNFTATYSGDANYTAITTPVGCGDPNELFTVTLQTLTLGTTASTNSTTVAPGTGVTDTAAFTTPAGGPTPTGTVTYTLVGPNPDPTCATPIVGTSTVAAGTPSNAFAVTAPGTYNFVATYSGDGFYGPISTPVGCNVAAERFAVATQTVSLTTAASTNSATVPPGTAVTDIATITPPAGGPPATGTVTYTLVGPGPDATCSAPVVGTSTMAVGQPSAPFTVTAVGTYNFVATYSGDANYSAITVPVGCGVAGEMFTVATRPIGLTTLASTNSGSVAPGAAVTDTATFTPPPGGPAPTGTVTYTLVGPGPNATCSAPLVGGPSTTPVGSPSAAFHPTAPGTYNFVATYSGDANYAAITTPVGCGDPNEIFSVALQPVNLSTTASTNATNVVPGATVTDAATLTPAPGAPTPTGTITYTLVGPNPDATCTGPVVGTPSTVAVGAPSAPFTVTTPGTYNFLATYSGDGFYAPITAPVGCGIGAERFSVVPAPVSIVTNASPPVPVGGTITDTATLSGGVAPTGTVRFDVFGPDNATCTGAPTFTSTVPVNGNGNYTSGAFTTTGAGAYRWIATYSGDANNAPAGPTACADALETSAGTKLTPTLVTTASAGAVGSSVFDTATLSNGFNPTGTITFRLFNNETCTGTPVFSSTKPVTGNGNVLSDTFILPGPGVYHFVATYSGDANNNAAGPTGCLDPNEAIGAGRLGISLTTTASGAVTVGNPISDTATVGGAFNPTGTVTFTLFGPDNATCTGAPVFTSVKPVNGNGTYPSDSFTPSAPGVYRWIATYSGDANNAPTATPCGDPLEQVTVNALPTIAITKAASPLSLPVPGGTFTFSVVVTNTSNEALTIRSLVDNIYGDITTLPGSTCNTAIGTVLAPSPGPGNTYSCHFLGDFRGPSGASQTDTVTVTATDTRGNTVHASANATVTLTPVPPSITTTKSAAPPSLQEPGGLFTFSYSVTNTGPEAVTITSIVDDVYGDLNGRGTCAVGARLAPNGGTYSCIFTGNFFGDAGATQTDTITTVGHDDRGQTVTSKASATVTITNVPPSIQIIKTPDPTSRPEPGGTFRFTVTVTNTSFEPITTTSLVDNIYGDLNGRGSCAIGVVLAANGGSYSCAFDGDFHGKAGDRQTDTVTVVAVDNENSSVTAKASATVTLTPVNVPPVVPPPVVPVVQPIVPVTVAPVQQVLVRTGANALRQAKLAALFLLIGMVLVAASWKFRGGPGLTPLPVGPRGGPRRPGTGGGAGGFRFGGGSRFDGGPPPPRGPSGGGTGRPATPAVDRAEAPSPRPTPTAPAPAPVPPSAFLDMIARPVRSPVVPAVLPVPGPAPASAPAPLEASAPAPADAAVEDREVLIPTPLPARTGNGLDATAMDARNALGPAVRQEPPPAPHRGRRFGGH